MSGLLFGVSATDITTFGVIPVLLGIVALWRHTSRPEDARRWSSRSSQFEWSKASASAFHQNLMMSSISRIGFE